MARGDYHGYQEIMDTIRETIGHNKSNDLSHNQCLK